MKPECFDSEEQYEAWLAQTRTAPVRPRHDKQGGSPNYCQDCNPEYQCRMKAKGRCRFPGTLFALVMEPPAGKLPTERELVGYEGAPPECADFTGKPAAARGSSPSAVSSPPAPSGLTPPTVSPEPLSGCRLMEDATPDRSL